MNSGYLAIHLHAHLPYIRHPEFPRFLEERWLFDAIVDTYVPLLERFEQLHNEGVPFRLSMTLSPTLLAMFADSLLQERFQQHLERQFELCDKELSRTADDPQFHPVVTMYHRRLNGVQQQFMRFGRDLSQGFRMLADMGHLEIVTCAVTHGFLPHMQLVPGAVERQLGMAVAAHQRYLERSPDGIWLPECAYYPGLENHLLDHGLAYCFMDTHALYLGQPRSLRGPFSHTYMPNGVAVFARDVESSKQVWSAREGYPGDGVYRDFYRDVGFDLPPDYVAPYIHDGRIPVLTGFKYYRITGDTDQKQPYDPELAQQKAEEHAQHFVWCREQQVRWLRQHLDREPIIVAPYDAELFGHWWFEGPDFLYHMFKAAARNPLIEAVAAKDYLLRYPSAQVVVPNPSSWGDGGYNRVWINGNNEWIYPHLNAAGRQAAQLAPEADGSGWRQRAYRQLQRELVLAQASDWAFILTTGTSPGYATQRTVRHLSAFRHLLAGLQANEEPPSLSELEARDGVF